MYSPTDTADFVVRRCSARRTSRRAAWRVARRRDWRRCDARSLRVAIIASARFFARRRARAQRVEVEFFGAEPTLGFAEPASLFFLSLLSSTVRSRPRRSYLYYFLRVVVCTVQFHKLPPIIGVESRDM